VSCTPDNTAQPPHPDTTAPITYQGNTLAMFGSTGTLNADGSFLLTRPYGELRGVFATEGGRTVIRDGVLKQGHSTGPTVCTQTFVATKQ
jgi:hypothetical protein